MHLNRECSVNFASSVDEDDRGKEIRDIFRFVTCTCARQSIQITNLTAVLKKSPC